MSKITLKNNLYNLLEYQQNLFIKDKFLKSNIGTTYNQFYINPKTVMYNLSFGLPLL